MRVQYSGIYNQSSVEWDFQSECSWGTIEPGCSELPVNDSTVPSIVNGRDWGCTVRDLETIIVLVLLAFNFIPKRSRHSLTLSRSRIRDSAAVTLTPGDGTTKVYRLRKVDAARIPTKTEYSFKGLRRHMAWKVYYYYYYWKRSAVQVWERVIYTLSVRRPQPHNTNL